MFLHLWESLQPDRSEFHCFIKCNHNSTFSKMPVQPLTRHSARQAKVERLDYIIFLISKEGALRVL